jgi:hypothetical protein
LLLQVVSKAIHILSKAEAERTAAEAAELQKLLGTLKLEAPRSNPAGSTAATATATAAAVAQARGQETAVAAAAAAAAGVAPAEDSSQDMQE